MDVPEVIPLTPDDDNFHPVSDHPHETETFWASFHHPERRLGGWFYNQVLFNQGVCNGGAWVWDASPAGALHEVRHHGLPLVGPDDMDLRDVALPNGNHLQMLEPLQHLSGSSLRSRPLRSRSALRGVTAASLASDGRRSVLARTPFRPVHACHRPDRARTTRRSTSTPSPCATGRGDRDLVRARRAPRDGVSRPPRDPAQAAARRTARSASAMCSARRTPTRCSSRTRCRASGTAPRATSSPPATSFATACTGCCVDGERRCEFDPEHEWMRAIWLDAIDEHGRELSAVGELVSHHGEHGQGTGYFHWAWNGMARTARSARTSRTRVEKCWKRCRAAGLWRTKKEQRA